MNDPTTIRRLYGRRTGHKIRAGQAAVVERLLPELAVPTDGPLDAATLFGDDRPLGLEIGFGRGEHLAWQAQHHAGMGFIGCEPFHDGVVGLLVKLDEEGIGNVRVHEGDALDVLERLPDGSLDMAWLLHPDPWPKARHTKRRFMNAGPIALIAAKLRPGGRFRFGTDHPVYCRWACMVMNHHPDFRWTAERPADFLERPDDWPQTRYEAKARRLGHEVWYFEYIRR